MWGLSAWHTHTHTVLKLHPKLLHICTVLYALKKHSINRKHSVKDVIKTNHKFQSGSVSQQHHSSLLTYNYFLPTQHKRRLRYLQMCSVRIVQGAFRAWLARRAFEVSQPWRARRQSWGRPSARCVSRHTSRTAGHLLTRHPSEQEITTSRTYESFTTF